MNIECFKRFKFSTTMDRFVIETPIRKYDITVEMYEYTVQKGEDMRLDLIMKAIYNDSSTFSDVDIILYLNGIDNPLNIREGQKIKYINKTDFDRFRYVELGGDKNGLAIKSILGAPNKTTRVDSNRTKFLESGYTLPPVLLSKSEPSVKIDETKIIVGGLK